MRIRSHAIEFINVVIVMVIRIDDALHIFQETFQKKDFIHLLVFFLLAVNFLTSLTGIEIEVSYIVK